MNTESDFFAFGRFKACFSMMWTELLRQNIIRLIMLFSALLIIVIWSALASYFSYTGVVVTNDPVQTSEMFFVVPLFVVLGCFFSSQIMRGLKDKQGRVHSLTLPVSPFESWLSRWIINVPLFLVAFWVCFYAADLLRVLLFKPLYPHIPIVPLHVFSYGWIDFLMAYFVLTSFYCAGASFFPRRPWLATSVIVFILGWVYGFIGLVTGFFMFGSDAGLVAVLLRAYFWLSVPFCWWLSYKRYKELEVIDRF